LNLFELKKQRENALAKADSITRAVEAAHREPTPAESLDVDNAMTAVNALNPRIAELEKNNSIRKMLNTTGGRSVLLIDGGRRFQQDTKVTLSAEYPDAFFDYVASRGQNVSAALYEGSSPAGGYAVPITVDDQIVPLAPNEMAVRQLAFVIPTAMDIKFPVKNSFSTATAKAETAAFTESELTLAQFTLSAYMAGVLGEVSWELAQDVPSFQASVVDDMILAQQMYEENLYINGTGTGQAQGLIGNVGAGGTYELDSNSNAVTINGTLSLMGQLNAVYWKNASWLMQRQTSIILRKAQAEANLFFPAFTSVNGQDYLHGHPIQYSEYMPAAARGTAPVLFGDFKRGYLIGDRGGSGINVKVLDQPLASQGLLQLLCYRRTDGRVRRSEAIQQYNVAAS
jgi:HK97 family phage major capsid protein